MRRAKAKAKQCRGAQLRPARLCAQRTAKSRHETAHNINLRWHELGEPTHAAPCDCGQPCFLRAVSRTDIISQLSNAMVREGFCLSHVAHSPWVVRHPTMQLSSFVTSTTLAPRRPESTLPLSTDVWLSVLAFCDHVALCRCRRACHAINRLCIACEGDHVWEPAARALARSRNNLKVLGNRTDCAHWRKQCVQAATQAIAHQRWSLLATARRVINTLAEGAHKDLQSARRKLHALPAQSWEQLRAHARSRAMAGASEALLVPAPAAVGASLRVLVLLAEGLMLFFGPLLAQPLRAKLQQAQVLAARLTPQLWLDCDRTLLQRLPALCFRDNLLLQYSAVRNASLYERIVKDESFCAAQAAAAGSAGSACFNFIAAVHQYARVLHTVQPMFSALDTEATRLQHFLCASKSPNLDTTATAGSLEESECHAWPITNAISTANHSPDSLPLPSQSLWEA